MDEALDEYELKKLLEHIADCITNDEYDDLDNLLVRLDRLRKKGLNVGYKKRVPVLDAYADKISGYLCPLRKKLSPGAMFCSNCGSSQE